MDNSNENKPANVNRLLKSAIESNANIVLNIFEQGSQHIDHVDNQYFGYTPTPPKEMKNEAEENSTLPKELRTEEAMKLWKIAQDAGYVDENFQPLVSRTQAALLANAMAKTLKIQKKWKVFETLWNRKNMVYVRPKSGMKLTMKELRSAALLQRTFSNYNKSVI